MSSIVPSSAQQSRSRAQTLNGTDREGLLLLPNTELDSEFAVEKRRRSSVGFEGYYDQYLGYEHHRKSEEAKSRSRSSGRTQATTTNHGGRAKLRFGLGGDNESQESFVLGVNDPNSPVSGSFRGPSPAQMTSTVVIARTGAGPEEANADANVDAEADAADASPPAEGV